MENIKLLFNKLIYNLYKIIYNLLNNNFIYRLLKVFFYLLRILEIFIDEMNWDIGILKSNYNKLNIKLKKIGIVKNLILIFLFILGIIPFIIIIYTIFYFIKYIFKYIFLILDFYFNDDDIKYNKIKYTIFILCEIIPQIIKKAYKFLFKSNWVYFFLKIILNYLEKKKNKIISYIFKKIDYFILVYLPKLFYKYQDKVKDDYRIFIIISFYKLKRKIFIIWPWRIKIFFLKLYKKICKKINMIKNYYHKKYIVLNTLKYETYRLKYRKIYIKIYYYIRIKYIYVKFTSIWVIKVFIRSEACFMTIQAFFILNYFRIRGYSIHIFRHIYYILGYKIIFNIYILRKKYYKKYIYLNMYIYFFIIWYREKIKYIPSFRFRIYLAIAYHFFVWKFIVFVNTDFCIDFRDEFYFLVYGDTSLSWWNLKLYSIVIQFFSKAYITNLFFHTQDWKNIIYVARFYFWWFGNLEIFIYDISYFIWHHIILWKPYEDPEVIFNKTGYKFGYKLEKDLKTFKP